LATKKHTKKNHLVKKYPNPTCYTTSIQGMVSLDEASHKIMYAYIPTDFVLPLHTKYGYLYIYFFVKEVGRSIVSLYKGKGRGL
jgi:hypothetical protein